MRKRVKIATISLLALTFAACSGGPGGGPSTLTKEEYARPDISVGDFIEENGKVVSTHHMGPFKLPAGTGSGDMVERPASVRFNIEESVWLTSFRPEIEDGEGNPLPPDLVHHIILVNHAEANTFCSTKQTGNPFAAATTSMDEIVLPEGYGYPVNPTDQLEAKVVLKNPTDQDRFNVYIKFTLTGEPIDGTKMIKDVRPMMVDIDPCDHKPISIPPGQFVEKVNSVFVPESGSIVKAYGFLYDYGVSIAMNVNDEGEPFWKGVVEIDENYKITGLPIFEDSSGVKINRGDKLGITVAYNNESQNWYDEAIGSAMVYMARGEEEPVKNSGDTETAPEEEKSAVSSVSAQQKLF